MISIFFMAVLACAPSAFGEGQKTGKAAAGRYFSNRTVDSENPPVTENQKTEKTEKKEVKEKTPAPDSPPSSARFLMVHAGGFLNDKSWEWGANKLKNVGRSTLGVTYRMGEWINSMDLMLRIDFNRYKLPGKRPLKMSLLPLVTFPDVRSSFPLYFGFGAGPGIFFTQTDGESDLSLDYQLLIGIRFLRLYKSMGLALETGLKNQIHILNKGQFNGVFLALGLTFDF